MGDEKDFLQLLEQGDKAGLHMPPTGIGSPRSQVQRILKDGVAQA